MTTLRRSGGQRRRRSLNGSFFVAADTLQIGFRMAFRESSDDDYIFLVRYPPLGPEGNRWYWERNTQERLRRPVTDLLRSRLGKWAHGKRVIQPRLRWDPHDGGVMEVGLLFLARDVHFASICLAIKLSSVSMLAGRLQHISLAK